MSGAQKEDELSSNCDCCGSRAWVPLFDENGVTLGRCTECDLHYVDDIPDPNQRMTEMEAGHYADSEQINAASKQDRGEQILRDRFQGYVDRAVRHVDGGRWLDIGCGAGLLMLLAADAGFETEGIELSGDRRVLAEQNTGSTVHGLPVEEVRYPDDSFDVISLINVFSHLISPTQTFDELRRILRPGGVVVLATGEMTDGVRHRDQLNWCLGDHLYFLGDRTMDRYATKSGFAVLEHDRRWLPDAMWSREWLKLRGRSRAKNAVKTVVDRTPGGLRLMRAAMLRRQADSKAHTSEFVLQVAGET